MSEPWRRPAAVGHDCRLRTRDRARIAAGNGRSSVARLNTNRLPDCERAAGRWFRRSPVAGTVRVEGGTIAAVGELEPLAGERMIDGGGQVLAPGFIDTHSHAADDLGEHPDAIPAVSQGITTIIAGQDGGSAYPLTDFFAGLGSETRCRQCPFLCRPQYDSPIAMATTTDAPQAMPK